MNLSSILQIPLLVFWFVIILVPLVVIHEFGHYLMSRLFGVKIPEFAVGFPLTRRWFYTKWKGTIWSFYPILIGGFVRIWGDNDAIDEAYDEHKIDPKGAKEKYIQSRFGEIMVNKELQFFLHENNLEFSAEWKGFENSDFAKGKSNDMSESEEKLYDKLAVLISWEFDKAIDSKDSFFHKNWIQQTLIISGGVLFNLITAIILFWILFAAIGIPKGPTQLEDISNYKPYINVKYEDKYVKVSGVAKDSSADKTGLKPKDELLKFAGVEVNNVKSQVDFKKIVTENSGKEVEVVYISAESGEQKTATVKLEDKGEKTLFGIGTLYKEFDFEAKDLGNAFMLSWNRTGMVIVKSFESLGNIVLALLPGDRNRDALNQVAGPIAVSQISSQIFNISGIAGILDVMGLISISLAVFNILPIPALDGGRWIIITINKLLGKRNRKLEAAVISVTFIALLLLGLVVAVKDVNGIIKGDFNF